MVEYESIDSITQQPCYMTEREAVTNFTFGIEEGKVKTYEELPYEDNEEGQGDAISGDHNAAADDMHVCANQWNWKCSVMSARRNNSYYSFS